MARKNHKNIKSNNFKVESNDPGLGFSPYRQSASMTRTDSVKDVAQRERKNGRAYAKHNWRNEY